MSAKHGRGTRAGASCRPGGILALGLLVAAAATAPAQASPLTQASTIPSGAAGFWDAYFTRALQTHATKVEIPPALRNLQAVNGLLPQTPFVKYLEWRW